VGAYPRERALDRIAELSGRGLDLVSFWSEASELVSPVVPNFMGPCWYTLDPASLLMTSHFNPAGMEHIPREWLELEYYGQDVHCLADVARSQTGASTLHDASGGDPHSSVRWQACKVIGAEQELLVALRTRGGVAWGAVGVYRVPDRPLFDREDTEFLRSAAPLLAEGAKRALLLGEAAEPEDPEAPGLLVLSSTNEVESSTAGVERWVSDLPGGDWDSGRLPQAVLAVAARASRSAEGLQAPGEVALARVLSNSGRWVVLHGATMVGTGPPRVAVIVEPAHPARIIPLLMSAYGLTEREQDITRLVLQGESTVEIAERLVVSPHTVQNHLKSVFEKTGVTSRRDLVGKVFFSHYEPRVRDNERRALEGSPLRGGPVREAAAR
jgi:DNA-binding CsgD family transcriptional regulator